MTHKASKVLEFLRNVQGDENCTLEFDPRKRTVRVRGDSDNDPVSISRFDTWFAPAVEYLELHGYIANFTEDQGYQFWVTHKGFHRWELSVKRGFGIFMRSVFAPIVVSIVTTLVTLWINGVIGSPGGQ